MNCSLRRTEPQQRSARSHHCRSLSLVGFPLAGAVGSVGRRAGFTADARNRPKTSIPGLSSKSLMPPRRHVRTSCVLVPSGTADTDMIKIWDRLLGLMDRSLDPYLSTNSAGIDMLSSLIYEAGMPKCESRSIHPGASRLRSGPPSRDFLDCSFVRPYRASK